MTRADELSAGASQLSTLAQTMVTALVDNPPTLDITVELEGEVCVIKVFTRSDEIGKLIGVHGRTARSMRCLLAASAGKFKMQCQLNIVEPGNPTHSTGNR